MPRKGKFPEVERQENRSRIFLILLREPLGFTDLLEATGFARSTLSQHLRILQRDKIVEKAIREGKVVYRTTLNEERMMKEMKSMAFDRFFEFLSEQAPVLGKLIQILVSHVQRTHVRSRILAQKLAIEYGRELTQEEIKKEVEKAAISEETVDEINQLVLEAPKDKLILIKNLIEAFFHIRPNEE